MGLKNSMHTAGDLMANAAEAEAMGWRGRQKILDEIRLDRYVERLNINVQQARQS